MQFKESEENSEMAKTSKRSQMDSIKKKLMAATAMLLVAAIMTVSSTYAWFTLSTAPEVTGITTTVGSNGNLEIALMNGETFQTPTLVGSTVGDSQYTAGKTVKDANITWGNLVDLADESYGLNKIVLYPSALNVTKGDVDLVNLVNFLKTPSYGADGRIIELLTNTVTGVYTEDETPTEGEEGTPVLNGAFNSDDSAYGVRAVGTATGLTPEQLAYRDAKGQMVTASSAAKKSASDSLVKNGSDLADIIVAHATHGEGNETYDIKYLETLESMVTTLESAMGSVETAIKSAILGYAASASGSSDLFKTVQGMMKDNTLDQIVGAYTGSLPEGVNTVINKYKETKVAVASSRAMYNDLAGKNPTSLTWADVHGVLQPLVEPNQVEINGIKADVFKENIDAAVSSILEKGLNVTLPTGSGVYADLADICGNYSTSVTISKVEYGSLKVTNMTAKMSTDSSYTTSMLSTAAALVTAAGAPSSTGVKNAAITDFYGYAIDLFLRTNAANSDLKLQVEAAQRVYTESKNEATQGGGSCMTFESEDLAKFSNEQVMELMKAIRIVFMNTADGEVYVYGKLDVSEDTIKVVGSEITAPIYLYKMVAETKTETAEDGTSTTKLTGKYLEEEITDNVIIKGMAQNAPVMLTVLVYLDGESVTNKDVANGTYSMKGKMNIQFCSSATLVAMKNTSLYEGEVGGTTESAATESNATNP